MTPEESPCAPMPGYSRDLRMTGGRCRDCADHQHEIVTKQEAWGNRWTCSCCHRTYFYSIGD